MNVIDTELSGVKIVEPQKFGDARGYFVETYNAARYAASGIGATFVQDNVSFSHRGVIRGLHWQAAPHAQAKLLSVVQGAVLDVAVDIRKGSPTFGRHVAVYLYADDSQFARRRIAAGEPSEAGRQLFIPRGFAHGFIVLEDNTLFSYKCDNLYHKPSERGMRFDDPALAIAWPEVGVPLVLSAKDQAHPPFAEIEPYAD